MYVYVYVYVYIYIERERDVYALHILAVWPKASLPVLLVHRASASRRHAVQHARRCIIGLVRAPLFNVLAK